MTTINNYTQAPRLDTPPEMHISLVCPPSRPGTVAPLTRVDLMGVERTALWVETLGKSEDWKEAEEYAKNFKENAITGRLLQNLNEEDLAELGINDERHKAVLLTTISFLYSPDPYSILYSSGWQRRSGYNGHTNSYYQSPSQQGTSSVGTSYPNSRMLCQTSGIDSDEMGTLSRRNSTEATQSYMTDVSSTQAQSHVSFTEIKMAKKASLLKSLTLVLREDQMSHDENTIIEQFASYDLKVEHLKKEGLTNRYSVLFPSTEMAAKALEKAWDLGFKLTRKSYNRPSPSNHVDYVNISGKFLIIREGKSFSQQKMGVLEPKARVTINQVKGRRARITHVVNGERVNRGWVSISNAEGIRLLEQL